MAAARARVASGSSTAAAQGLPHPAADTQTPARSAYNPLRPRLLDFHTTTESRKRSSAASIAHEASIDELPNRRPVSVTVTPSAVGQDGAPVSAAVGASSPAPLMDQDTVVQPPPKPPRVYGVKPGKPDKLTGDSIEQNERVGRWIEDVNTWLRLSYKVHLFGPGHPRCDVVQHTPPQPLK